MRVVANVGVSDEATLIQPCIHQLLSQGVDEIVVADTGSKDGTLEILQRMKKEGKIHLLAFDEHDKGRFQYAQRMLEFTRDRLNADWVTFVDADEFFCFRHDSIQSCLDRYDEANVISIPRFNVPLSNKVETYRLSASGLVSGLDTWMIGEPIDEFRQQLISQPHLPWIAGRIMPKVFARPQAAESYFLGGHGVSGSGLVKADASHFMLLHLPFTDYERFLDKVTRISVLLDRYKNEFFGEGKAWHWKRWASILKEGHLEDEYARQFFIDNDPQLSERVRVMRASDYWRRES